MPLVALGFVLIAGVLHATWNLIAKRAGGDMRFAAFSSLFMLVFWSPVGLTFAARDVPGWGGPEWACVAGSALIHLPYYLFLLHGYRVADLTVVYPTARGLGPLVTTTVAVTVLGEPLTAGTLGGVLCIALGILLVAGFFDRLRKGPAAPAEERARVRRGLIFGAGTGLAIGGYTLVDGYAVKHLGMSPVLVAFGGDFIRTFLFLPLILRDRPGAAAVFRAQWKAALLVGLIGPGAYMLVLTAAQMAPLSHVAPAREISLLVAALLGGRLLGEGHGAARLAGAAVMVAGVLLLAFT